MRSYIILVVGIGLFLAVIFGMTFISQYAGNTDDDGDKTIDATQSIVGPPLRFSTSRIAYDPASDELPQKYFQSFYEVSEQLALVSYWFQNPHTLPVTITVRGRSCTSCTSARVAIIPNAALTTFKNQVALARFPMSSFPVPDLITPLAETALMNSLDWKGLDFDRPEEGVLIPATSDPNTPTWGIFQMLIKVTAVGPKQLGAEVGMSVGTMPLVRQPFMVAVNGVAPFDVTPRVIPIGDFPEGATARSYELIYWSSTREQADLGVPIANVDIKDPFVVVGTPVPFTPEERARYVSALMTEGKSLRCTAGYKIPVTVHRRRNETTLPPGSPVEPDIGPFDRQIGITSQGTTAVTSVAITANVSGLVALSDGLTVDLKDFNGRFGTERTVNLVSDRMDLQLELVKGQSKPSYLEVTLSEPRSESGRRYWSLKVGVPKEACLQELPSDSYLIFSGKSGKETYRVRIPVKGRGFARGN